VDEQLAAEKSSYAGQETIRTSGDVRDMAATAAKIRPISRAVINGRTVHPGQFDTEMARLKAA
jgi:hypothetical protein